MRASRAEVAETINGLFKTEVIRKQGPWRGVPGERVYARVFAPGQHPLAMQKRQLREYAERRGWTVAREVEGSARARSADRSETSSSRTRVDASSTLWLVWRLDRWGRSLSDLVVTLQELQEPASPSSRSPTSCPVRCSGATTLERLNG